MKIIAIVPARSGSKGFPNKNVAKINGKSLLEKSIETGLSSPLVNEVYLSTDSPLYESIGIKAGAKSLGLRDETLSSDSANTVDVVVDILGKINITFDYVLLLQPTSPIRTNKDIANMLDVLQESNGNAVVSLYKVEEPHPHKMKVLIDDEIFPLLSGSTSELPRQSLSPVYALNGALYLVKADILLKDRTFFPEKTLPYIMESSINIDAASDFEYLKYLVERKLVVY